MHYCNKNKLRGKKQNLVQPQHQSANSKDQSFQNQAYPRFCFYPVFLAKSKFCGYIIDATITSSIHQRLHILFPTAKIIIIK